MNEKIEEFLKTDSAAAAVRDPFAGVQEKRPLDTREKLHLVAKALNLSNLTDPEERREFARLLSQSKSENIFDGVTYKPSKITLKPDGIPGVADYSDMPNVRDFDNHEQGRRLIGFLRNGRGVINYKLLIDPERLREINCGNLAGKVEGLILESAIHLELAKREVESFVSSRPLVCLCQETGSSAVQRAHANLANTLIGQFYSKVHALPRKMAACKGVRDSCNPDLNGEQRFWR